jgi:hypothetical protein
MRSKNRLLTYFKISTIMWFVLPVLVMVILVLTTQFDSFKSGWFHSNWDASNYRKIALNFQLGKSVMEAVTIAPDHHAYRWVLPWIVSILPFEVDTSFFVFNILLVLILAIIIYIYLDRKLLWRSKLVCYFTIVSYSYYMRFYLFDPYQLSDVIFAISIPLLVIGVEQNNILTILGACLLGVIGRQTALVFVPL